MSPQDPPTRPRFAILLRLSGAVALAVALLASVASPAEAQRETTDRPNVASEVIRDIEPLRMSCNVDSIDGHRGVLCRWSKTTNSNTRAYQLYRIVGQGQPRELLATVGADGRLGYFDRDLTAPSTPLYGVVALNQAGRVIGQSKAVRVQFGQPEPERLRMACAADSIEGQRGVLCRWSEPRAEVRGYIVYRIVGDDHRRVIATIPAGGRQAHFDTAVQPGEVHIYGVTAVDGAGDVLAIGGPRRVAWPSAD